MILQLPAVGLEMNDLQSGLAEGAVLCVACGRIKSLVRLIVSFGVFFQAFICSGKVTDYFTVTSMADRIKQD